jgi:hypothetical protein
VVLDVDHPDMAGSRGDLWLDQYVFVAGRRLVKTVLIGASSSSTTALFAREP